MLNSCAFKSVDMDMNDIDSDGVRPSNIESLVSGNICPETVKSALSKIDDLGSFSDVAAFRACLEGTESLKDSNAQIAFYWGMLTAFEMHEFGLVM